MPGRAQPVHAHHNERRSKRINLPTDRAAEEVVSHLRDTAHASRGIIETFRDMLKEFVASAELT